MARKPTPTAAATHNGREIVGTKIEIRKTGGEFSEDLLVANIDALDGVRVGSELVLAMRVRCVDEHHPAEDRKDPAAGGVFHKLVFDPAEVTVVDASIVEASFVAQRDRVQQAKDRAVGNTTVDGQIRAAEHERGEHTELVDGCSECERERELTRAGR